MPTYIALIEPLELKGVEVRFESRKLKRLHVHSIGVSLRKTDNRLCRCWALWRRDLTHTYDVFFCVMSFGRLTSVIWCVRFYTLFGKMLYPHIVAYNAKHLLDGRYLTQSQYLWRYRSAHKNHKTKCHLSVCCHQRHDELEQSRQSEYFRCST